MGAEKNNNNNNVTAGRPPSLKKWIENNCDVEDTFNLKNYYKNFPQYQQYDEKFQKEIIDMIEEKMLERIDDNRFKVSKK